MIATALAGCNSEHVHETNQSPVISDIPNLTVKEGQDFSYSVKAEDEQSLTFSLEGAPEWIVIESKTGIISVDSSKSETGDYVFTVIVSDGELESRQVVNLKVVSHEIDPDNTAPVIQDIPALTARTNYPLNYVIQASDAEFNALTFDLIDNPDFVSIDAETGLLVVDAKTGHEQEEAYAFKVQVTDGNSYTEAEVSLTVEYAQEPSDPDLDNTIPSIQSVPKFIVKAGEKDTHRAMASDADRDVLTFTIDGNPDWVSIDPLSGLISVTPKETHVGNHSFNIVVTDGLVDVVQSFDIEVHEGVAEEQNAPLVSDIPLLTTKAGQQVSYRVKANDEDGDDLHFWIDDMPSWMSIDSKIGLIIANPTASDYGYNNFVLTVSDGLFDVKKEFSIYVAHDKEEIPENNAPVIQDIEDMSMKTRQTKTISIEASDEDGDALIYSMTNELDWITLNPKTGLISFSPKDENEGTHSFTVSVEDGKESASTTFELTVALSATLPTNTIPVIDPISTIKVADDETVVYRVTAFDADADQLTYSLVDSPMWATIDASTGLLELNPPKGANGEFSFKVKVSDGSAYSLAPVVVKIDTNTEPCPDGSCLEDDGFTHPELPVFVPVVYNATLNASGKLISGEVTCEDDDLSDGKFVSDEETQVTCQFGSVTLGTFEAKPYPEDEGERPETYDMSYDLTELHNPNVTKVLQAISTCQESDSEICLDSINSFDIIDIYEKLDDEDAVNAFLDEIAEKATDKVDEAPSSHVDPDLAPVVSGGSNDLESDFVSVVAESSMQYKPSQEAKVASRAILTDDEGRVLSGISYFASKSRGITDSNGEFEYHWGDNVTFGIDTFEIGTLKANKVEFKITDVSESPVVKANIQALLERYGSLDESTLTIGSDVTDVFSQYPNVINELINLNLPNGGVLEGSEGFETPDEFDAQFEQGLTAAIDAQLNKNNPTSFSSAVTYSAGNGGYVTDSLNEILKGVEHFHVFHDNVGGYSATGVARATRSLNLSNQAFPLMMPRNDINKAIPFGNPQAWTREGKPYIAEYPGVVMPEIPTVNDGNATYGLPFVTVGELGAGKVVFMGNSMYPSILSCPDNFWANDHNEIRIDSTNKTCTADTEENDVRSDNGNMKLFFDNLFNWLSPDVKRAAFNMDKGLFMQVNVANGNTYDFFVHDSYGFESVTKVESGSYASLDPSTTPILIIQGYETRRQYYDNTADLSKPLLTQEDITDLIKYINDGGNVLFMDAITQTNPEPIGRLADSVGVAVGGNTVLSTSQSNCDPGDKYCSRTPPLNSKQEKQIVVIQKFDNMAGGKPPFTVNEDGTVTWASDADMIATPFHIPTYEVPTEDGNTVERLALIRVNNETERQDAIEELQAAFEGMPVCQNDYEYEFNCIEVRSGTGIKERAYGRPDFQREYFSVDSMIKAANLGTNIQALADHELYYRTSGEKGIRLSLNELNQTYDNMSVWLWNNNDYRFVSDVQDELGFKRLVQYMNCYTDNTYGGNAACPEDLKETLVSNDMIYGAGDLSGYMNPSYPLNYQEKPLTRIMLGRSFWDYRVKVDTTDYPTRPTNAPTTQTVNILTGGSVVNYSASNNQSTGLWLQQHVDGVVKGGVRANITVMFGDDLTGRSQHETNLNRPPRMTKTFLHDGSETVINTPYGGLVYVQPLENTGESVQFEFQNVLKAPYYKDGEWITSPDATDVKFAEIDTGDLIYTTPVKNVEATDLDQFSADMTRFTDAANDFYGRDSVEEDSAHRIYTSEAFKHRYFNDVQISIGDAHSGYPVMASGYNAERNTIPTSPKNDWLLWHELGHNLVEAPLSVPGGTEVTNNVFALYMQELEGRNANPEMDRIRSTLPKLPSILSIDNGHVWANADAGIRLGMFGQLKIWAETHFDLANWYAEGDVVPSVYGEDNGWNMIKLMHRKARGDVQGDLEKNYCDARVTGLSGGDNLMVCASYASGYDLSDFFKAWNVGESSTTTTEGEKIYFGGISSEGLRVIAEMGLEKPEINPLSISSLN